MQENLKYTETRKYNFIENQIDYNEVITTAFSVISMEIKALEKQLSALNINFFNLVYDIYKSKGRIVFSGVGKSAIIAKKIAATFSSLGISSFFIDPVSALHGDLGSLKKDDLCVILSYSGNTSELKNFIFSLKNLNIKTAAITSDENSFLAKNCDVFFKILPVIEACPLGLAPSSSTTAMLAVGDALAFCVAKLRNITTNEFAKYHPSGSIGIKTLKVKDIMRKGEKCPVVLNDSKIIDAIDKMTSSKMGAVCIVDSTNHLLGYFTDGDLRRLISYSNINLNDKIESVMNKYPITVNPDNFVCEAIEKMKKFGFDNIPVVDKDNHLVGILDERDILSV